MDQARSIPSSTNKQIRKHKSITQAKPGTEHWLREQSGSVLLGCGNKEGASCLAVGCTMEWLPWETIRQFVKIKTGSPHGPASTMTICESCFSPSPRAYCSGTQLARLTPSLAGPLTGFPLLPGKVRGTYCHLPGGHQGHHQWILKTNGPSQPQRARVALINLKA